jgi:hypothetical protein
MASLKDTIVLGNLTASGKISKVGGTSSEILLADGSVITKDELQSSFVDAAGSYTFRDKNDDPEIQVNYFQVVHPSNTVQDVYVKPHIDNNVIYSATK